MSLGLVLIPDVSMAGIRTVQFSGMTGVIAKTAEGIEKGDQALCWVQVVNVGKSKQKIESAQFAVFSPSSSGAIPVLEMRGAQVCALNSNGQPQTSGSGGDSLPCPPPAGGKAIELTPGDTYLLGVSLMPSYQSELVHQCSGVIRVSDSDPAQRGSVIASGVLVTRQEVRLLDGILSGAYYASGTHFEATSQQPGDLDTADNVIGGALGSGNLRSGTMNLGCVHSCRQMNYNAEFCDAQCGAVSLSTQLAYWTRSGGGLISSGSQISQQDPNASFETASLGSIGQVPVTVYQGLVGKVPFGSMLFPNEGILIKFPSYSGIRMNLADLSDQTTGTPPCFTFYPNTQAGWAYSSATGNEHLRVKESSTEENRCRFPRASIRPILNLFADHPSYNLSSLDYPNQRLLLPNEVSGTDKAGNQAFDVFGKTIQADISRGVGVITPEYVSRDESGRQNPTGFGLRLNPSTLLTTTNSHFAGGMVYEWTLGPMKRICTAQKAARELGGLPPSHSRTRIDYEDGGKTKPGMLVDNERLYCSHRHGLGDLVFSTADATPISINGGRPF